MTQLTQKEITRLIRHAYTLILPSNRWARGFPAYNADGIRVLPNTVVAVKFSARGAIDYALWRLNRGGAPGDPDESRVVRHLLAAGNPDMTERALDQLWGGSPGYVCGLLDHYNDHCRHQRLCDWMKSALEYRKRTFA